MLNLSSAIYITRYCLFAILESADYHIGFYGKGIIINEDSDR